MKPSTRIKVGRGLCAAADVTMIAAGTTATAFHVKEIMESKSYDPLKDGVRDVAAGMAICSGIAGLIQLGTTHKAVKAACDVADTVGDAGEDVAKAVAKAVTNTIVSDDDAE